MRKSKYHGSLPPDDAIYTGGLECDASQTQFRSRRSFHTVHRPKYHYGSTVNDDIGTGVTCLLQLLTPIIAWSTTSEHQQCWRAW